MMAATRIGFYLFLFLYLPYLCIATEIYHPDDVYSINCGFSEHSTFNGRNWTADTNKLFSESSSSSSVSAKALTPTTIQGPYSFARVSYSQFTYSFPLSTSGPKFIRLLFYPTSYQNLDPTKALFSVKSGDYTLLKDFNATLYAEADDDPASDMFFREYSVNVQDGNKVLNITFIPSSSSNKSSSSSLSGPFDYYAFINGIEVVSMPPYLYHTKPGDRGLQLVGSTSSYTVVDNNTALETKYRLRVGGSSILASDDTGMLRQWEGDGNYIDKPNDLASNYKGPPPNFNFSLIPNYTAPAEIYQYLRHMGPDWKTNLRFNLTWKLPVDSGFKYMLRLHFCELDPKIIRPGLRKFFIYIQDRMADDNADVLNWTDGNMATPIFKDFAVNVAQANNKQVTTVVSLKMSPKPHSVYADAVLNALELFKISDPQGNLAGPNPDTPPSPSSPSAPQPALQNKSSSSNNIVAPIVGTISGVLFVLALVAFFFFKRRHTKNDNKDYYDGGSHNRRKSEGTSSSLPTNLCRHFSIEEIRAATNNLDDLFVVGVGGFGNVYKGYIGDGATPVAIKRLKPGSQQGAHEFMNEIEMLSQLRHLHLVSLIGYCYESNEMILVYDFMTRGTLRDHLYNTDNPSLSWKQRLNVCIGAARGLHYLHTGAKHMIIHRDVKSTNILLDDKWVAKVSDFGLSRFGPIGTSMTHVSTVVKGSIGYMDPEYYKRQRLTEKSDVYSFGVVLLEVLCGRQPLLRNVEKRQVSLVDWARQCHHAGTLGEIVDPTMKGEIAAECLRTFGELAIKCLLDDGSKRPSMNDVVGGLEFALQLQENSAAAVVVKENRWNFGEESDEMFSSSTSSRNNVKSSTGISITTSSGDHSSTFGTSKESQWLMSDNVFSEINGDPKGR